MPHAAKPFSQASERNQQPILEILRDLLAHSVQVLEIGSGTGQHAAFFARHLPHLQWHTSDLPEQHAGILAWIADAALPNVRAPLDLDVDAMTWPVREMDAVFSANTAHIVAWPQVRRPEAAPLIVPAADHFSVLAEYADPQSALTRATLGLF